MTIYTLRSARETDSDAVKDIIHSAGINPISLDWRRFTVAVDAHDRVIATGQIKPHGSEKIGRASCRERV